jgi:hypothetical protein
VAAWPQSTAARLDHPGYDAAIDTARAAVGADAFAELWAAGETLAVDAALERGLAVVALLQQVLGPAPAAADRGVAGIGD